MAPEAKAHRGNDIDAKTVFVRGLPLTLTDAQLEEAFSDVAPVRRAFTVKEKETNKHRGIAFVQFAVAEDAKRAVDLKNDTSLEGRKIKVEIAKRRAPLNERRMKELETRKKAKEAGKDEAGVVPAVEEKKSNKRERSKNSDHLQNQARPVEEKVQENKKQKLSQNAEAGSTKQKPARTVVIANLGDVNLVVGLAEKLGTVESIEKSVTNSYLNDHGLSRDGCKQPCIVVVFASVRAAREAVATFHQQKLGDNVLWARQLGGEGSKLKKWRLIVRNLPFKVTEEILRAAFGTAGFIWEITIPRKPDGQSKGFAFVGYTSKGDAEKAIKDLNAKKIANRTVAVDWAVAKSKYENLKSAENEKSSDTSDPEADETASEAESDENVDNDEDSDDERVEDSNANELDIVQKVLDKVVAVDKLCAVEKVPENDDLADEEDFADEYEQDDEDEEGDEEDEDEQEESVATKSADENVPGSSVKDDDIMERTVFMRNLPLDAKAFDLRKKFSEFGEIKSFRLVFHPTTRKSKGTAFVEFATKEGAEAVVNAAKGAEQGKSDLVVGGMATIVHFAVDRSAARTISTKKSIDNDRRNLFLLKEGVIEPGTKAAEGVSKSDMIKRQALQTEKATKLRSPNFHVSKTRLAIHNFPKSMSEKDLKQLFIKAVVSRATKQRPVVKQVKLLMDDKETSRGSGFVEFTEHQHALVALRVLNNNPETFNSEKRPIVEFAIDNMAKLKTRETRLATRKFNEYRNQKDGVQGQEKATPGQGNRKANDNDTKGNTNAKQGGKGKRKRDDNDKKGDTNAKQGWKGKRKRDDNDAQNEEGTEEKQAKTGTQNKKRIKKDSQTQDDKQAKLPKHLKEPSKKQAKLQKHLKEPKQKRVEGPIAATGNKQKGKQRRQEDGASSGNQQKPGHENGIKSRRSRKTENNAEDKLDKLVKEYRTKYFSPGGKTESGSKNSKTLDSIKRWFE